jgi:hypothetical protein
MEMQPPPYKRHLKTSSEFIKPIYPAQFGDDFTAEVVQRLADARDQAAEHLPAIRQRIDALYDALDDGWCAPRGIENQLGHLHRVLSPYHLSRYLKDAIETLQEAEADLATWRQMTEAQREERWAKHERDDAEAAERRKAEAVLRARHEEFYATMKQLNVSPPRWLDNEIAKWSLA